MTTRKMRMLAASLALVMCVSLYSAPRAKAVATEVAVGTAAVASYFQATGLTMAASAGSTGALITTGVADIAGSYAMATGAASSGSAFLSSVAAGVSISPAGALVLTAAAVVAIGALVAWYVEANSLLESGAVTQYNLSGFYASDGSLYYQLPYNYRKTNYFSIPETVSPTFFSYDVVYSLANGSAFQVVSLSSTEVSVVFDDFTCTYSCSAGFLPLFCFTSNYINLYDVNGNREAATQTFSVDFNSSCSVVRTSEFTQPDTELQPESQKQMVIDLGLSPGISLDEAAEKVPNLIATSTLAPTYEITSTETGEGTDTETDPDEETGIYIPILSDIKTRLDTLGDSITDGIMSGLQSLFVPDEAFFAEAVPELQELFQGRMGLLTFPISLLADFLGRLLDLSDQEPILRWDSVRIYGTELIAAGQYNLNDSLASTRVKQMHDIYMVVVNAILIFAFLGLCQNKYRKIMQN